ncbi:hypothetical protein STRCI_008547 [Streptomyces cinnabarinus]|uniref:Uncharacterized protein n=1 Tax=Streptomyces cinnabarinus TaxID=67287 RepID=A0ABY7KQP1_9ACTN|nr:hypothetical protein [Streptomyces cinnabarinus]WAZ26881.1 hypothetical protein STRCI_008547 [Streptomyces cinnabarinus]
MARPRLPGAASPAFTVCTTRGRAAEQSSLSRPGSWTARSSPAALAEAVAREAAGHMDRLLRGRHSRS